MAPAAAPPHRGLPAGQAGPRGWPDKQGAGRLASPAAAASHPGRSYGRGGSRRRRRAGGEPRGGFLGPDGLASRTVRRGSAAAPEPGRHPRLLPRRRPPLPAAQPAPRAAPPLSGFAARRGTAGLAPAPTPLQPRRAENGCGGDSSHRFIPARPTGTAARPGLPESPPEGPGARPGVRVGRAGHTEAPTVLATVAAPSAAAPSSPGLRRSAGSPQPQLGPPPRPGAHDPGSPEKPGTEHARRGARRGAGRAARGRGGAGAWAWESLWRGRAGSLFRTDHPAYRALPRLSLLSPCPAQS